MTLLNRTFLSNKYRIVPGTSTVSLTVDPLTTAPVTYQVSGVRKRPSNQGAMAGSPFGSELVSVVFNLPRATMPAGIEPAGGMWITDADGKRWCIQSNAIRLLDQYYKVGCNLFEGDNEYVPAPPPDSGGEPEEPPGPVPTVEIAAVSPDPRATAISSLLIVFNKPVTGFDLASLTLTRNAGANLLTGSQTLTTSDNQTWTLGNLSSLTGTNGTYLLTVLAGPGIVDQAGQALEDNDTEQWVMNSSLFTAAITAVSPDPRNSAVSSVTIVFSAAVDSGFTLADLTLRRNGGSNLLTGSQTLTSGDNITWTLGNLSGLTASSGTYLVTLTASGSGIVDGSANPLSGDATESWVTDATAPTATITPVTADPRTLPVESVQVVFSEPVTGVSAGAFTLSLNGGANLLTGGQTVTTSDNLTWTLHGLTAVSGAVGTYLLTLNALGSGIQDLAGNAITANATDSWVVVAPAITALPTSDDRTEAGMYQTSRFLDNNPGGPYPHKWVGIVIDYDQANILPTEVLTGLPGGPAKLQQQLDKIKLAAPQAVRFMEVTGSAILTPDIMNAYREPGGLAGRTGGRGAYNVHGVQWSSDMLGKIRVDYNPPNGVREIGTSCTIAPNGQPNQPGYQYGTAACTSIEAKAVMDFTTPSRRAYWVGKMLDLVLPYFAQFPDYQGLWMDEQADKRIDFYSAPIGEMATGYWGPIRDAIRAQGKLLSINLTTHCQFTDAEADAIVDSIDVLVVEKMWHKPICNLVNFPVYMSRLRRMWARNPAGFGIFSLQGIDHDNSNRECRITAATNAPVTGQYRITCATPHYLDNTANKNVAIYNLSPLPIGYYRATKVTDTVFDIVLGNIDPPGTLIPSGSSLARFVESDLEVTCALGMIARQQAGRPYYVYWVPGGPEYEPYRWPTLYGQPSGDYEILETGPPVQYRDQAPSPTITKLRCNFSGGTLGPHRVTIEPQAARRAYWEPL